MQWNGRTLTHEVTIIASDNDHLGIPKNDIVDVLGQAINDPDNHHGDGTYQDCMFHMYDTPGDVAANFHNTAGTVSGDGPGFADFNHATDGIRCYYRLVGGKGRGCCNADGSTVKITALPDENMLPAGCVEPE
jgi:hypothetical protein